MAEQHVVQQLRCDVSCVEAGSDIQMFDRIKPGSGICIERYVVPVFPPDTHLSGNVATCRSNTFRNSCNWSAC